MNEGDAMDDFRFFMRALGVPETLRAFRDWRIWVSSIAGAAALWMLMVLFALAGEWYFFGDDGWLRSGWLQRGKRWYYLSPNHDGHFGRMVTGWIQDDGKWYFSGNEGLVSGWQEIEDEWYRFEEAREGSFGSMLTGWTKSSGEWYWLWPDGHMGAGEIIRTDGKAYMLDAEGRVVTDRDVTVHFDESGAAVLQM